MQKRFKLTKSPWTELRISKMVAQWKKSRKSDFYITFIAITPCPHDGITAWSGPKAIITALWQRPKSLDLYPLFTLCDGSRGHLIAMYYIFLICDCDNIVCIRNQHQLKSSGLDQNCTNKSQNIIPTYTKF